MELVAKGWSALQEVDRVVDHTEINDPRLIPLLRMHNMNLVVTCESRQMMYKEASQVANDAVRSIQTVGSSSVGDKVMKLCQKKCEGPTKTGIRQGLISGIDFRASFFVLFSAYAALNTIQHNSTED